MTVMKKRQLAVKIKSVGGSSEKMADEIEMCEASWDFLIYLFCKDKKGTLQIQRNFWPHDRVF